MLNGEGREVWEKINGMVEVLAILKTEVSAIHRRLDEFGGHIQTREMCEERHGTLGLRFGDHEERIKGLESAGVADHEERIKTLEDARRSTPARVLWLLLSAIFGVLGTLVATGKI